MAEKFLILNRPAGGTEEKEATTVSTGAAQAGHIPALGPDGKLDESMLPESTGGNVRAVVAAEVLTAHDLVYIGDNAGSPGVFRATGANGGHRAVGFVKDSAAIGETVNVYFEGIVGGQSGLTIGGRVFLGMDLGSATQTPLSGAGKLSQIVGDAISATEFSFEPGMSIKMA